MLIADFYSNVLCLCILDFKCEICKCIFLLWNMGKHIWNDFKYIYIYKIYFLKYTKKWPKMYLWENIFTEMYFLDFVLFCFAVFCLKIYLKMYIFFAVWVVILAQMHFQIPTTDKIIGKLANVYVLEEVNKKQASDRMRAWVALSCFSILHQMWITALFWVLGMEWKKETKKSKAGKVMKIIHILQLVTNEASVKCYAFTLSWVRKVVYRNKCTLSVWSPVSTPHHYIKAFLDT